MEEQREKANAHTMIRAGIRRKIYGSLIAFQHGRQHACSSALMTQWIEEHCRDVAMLNVDETLFASTLCCAALHMPGEVVAASSPHPFSDCNSLHVPWRFVERQAQGQERPRVYKSVITGTEEGTTWPCQ